jgi:hypothetical protein
MTDNTANTKNRMGRIKRSFDFIAYLFFKLFKIETRTAVCGELTGGISSTVTNRSSLSSGHAIDVIIYTSYTIVKHNPTSKLGHYPQFKRAVKACGQLP